MVYQNKLVACVKVNGQILRESGENTVTLPFGSEYSVFLKNLNSVRAIAKVSVDGKDATEGTWLIVPANGTLELERSIRNGNFDSGNRFKFIERTGDIEKHRGVGAEDGLIRVEFKAEQVVREETIVRKHYVDEYECPWWPPYPRPFPRPPRWPLRPQFSSRVPERGVRSSLSANAARITRSSASARSMPGITVAGSRSNQRFTSGEWFPTVAQSEVIVLHLRGEVAGKPVTRPATVKDKIQCPTCGKPSKGADFCPKCGTALFPV
jgi:hypothetical protein